MKKILGKDTVIIITTNQAEIINKSFKVFKKEASLNKLFIDSLRLQYNINQKNLNLLYSDHSSTIKSLESLSNNYDRLSKVKNKDLLMFEKLDRNAELSAFSIVLAVLIIIIVQKN